MDHVRTQIRDAVVALLGDLPTTQDRVYPGRSRPLDAEHDASLLIYMRNDVRAEQWDSQASPSPLVGRRCTLVCEGRVATAGTDAAQDAEDLLDDIEAEATPKLIEAVASSDGALRGLVLALEWDNSNINVRADGARHIGSNLIEFLVHYRTPENNLRQTA